MNKFQQMLQEHDRSLRDLAEDPMMQWCGLFGEFSEDWDKNFRKEIGEAIDSGEFNTEEVAEALEYLGQCAQNAYEKRVYRDR